MSIRRSGTRSRRGARGVVVAVVVALSGSGLWSPGVAVAQPQAISGSASPIGATELTVGEFVDFFPSDGPFRRPDGTVKYYGLTVPRGSVAHVALTAILTSDPVPDVPGGQSASMEVNPEGRARCIGSRVYAPTAGATRERPSSALAVIDNTPSGRAGSCSNTDRFELAVTRQAPIGYELAPGDPWRMEIAVRIEPPVDPAGLPPAVAEVRPPVAVPADSAAVTPVTGGGSFGTATEITPGTTYGDAVAPGEPRYYRIPLGWGQRLGYRVTTAGPPSGRAEDITRYPLVYFDVLSPVRETLPKSGEIRTFFGAEPDSVTGSMPWPARYHNREFEDRGSGQRNYGYDGYHYLRVWASIDPGKNPAPYTLTVAVEGTPEPGPDSGQPRIDTAPAPPAVAGPPADTGWVPGERLWAGVLGGVLALAVIGVVLLVGVRSSRRRRSAR